MNDTAPLRGNFTVTQVDPDGKRFEKVSRISARSEDLEVHITLDINSDMYPMGLGEKFCMALASTLSLDGSPDSGHFVQSKTESLADEFEYVMQGKIYQILEKQITQKLYMSASFGGLLMHLEGDIGFSEKFDLNQRLFILMKKNH